MASESMSRIFCILILIHVLSEANGAGPMNKAMGRSMIRGILSPRRPLMNGRLVSVAFSIESYCFNKTGVNLPESLTKSARPQVPNDKQPSDDDDSQNDEISDSDTLTYDFVRGEVVSLLSLSSEVISNRYKILNNLLTHAEEAAKFMETLPQDKVKELLLCMHSMALVEPLKQDKNVMEMRKQLACEVTAKMKGEASEKCAKA